MFIRNYHVFGLHTITLEIHHVSKNVPTLASCGFDKHGLILIIFSKHQHTFNNYMHI